MTLKGISPIRKALKALSPLGCEGWRPATPPSIRSALREPPFVAVVISLQLLPSRPTTSRQICFNRAEPYDSDLLGGLPSMRNAGQALGVGAS